MKARGRPKGTECTSDVLQEWSSQCTLWKQRHGNRWEETEIKSPPLHPNMIQVDLQVGIPHSCPLTSLQTVDTVSFCLSPNMET